MSEEIVFRPIDRRWRRLMELQDDIRDLTSQMKRLRSEPFGPAIQLLMQAHEIVFERWSVRYKEACDHYQRRRARTT